MPFFIMLLAYVTRRSLDSTDSLNTESVWRQAFRWGASAPSGREARVWPGIVIVAIPALVLLVIDYALRMFSVMVLTALVDYLMLVLLMGAPGWKPRLKAYTEAWQRGDMQGAWYHVKDSLPARERGAASAPENLHLSVSCRFMVMIFERYFLIIFWYVVGGIAVAFLVRAVLALRDHWPQAAARPAFGVAANILSWLPVRILSFTFGLAGDLTGWLRTGRSSMTTYSESPSAVLLQAANSALTGYALEPSRFQKLHPGEWSEYGGRSFFAIRDLLNRSMLVWICVLALLVIAGIIV
ncbi:histidine kinase [Marinobacter changyiensis]|uniref:histidine kinase n=1 Tax=Marinobacter changyiensis TaxID=2604091 RepID=UPI0012643E6B|nr:histidine kinase [Marinobacter changyiensis]